VIVLEPQSDLNEACVGYYAKQEGPCLIYDYDLLIECFVESGMTEDEEIEWIDYNIVGAYMGPQNPVIMQDVSR